MPLNSQSYPIRSPYQQNKMGLVGKQIKEHSPTRQTARTQLNNSQSIENERNRIYDVVN